MQMIVHGFLYGVGFAAGCAVVYEAWTVLRLLTARR